MFSQIRSTANVTTFLKLGFYTFIALAIVGCGEKYPEAYGLYAWKGSQWIPLGKDKSQIELDLPAKTKFLVHDKAIEFVSHSFNLQAMVFVRNQISQSPEGTNRVVKPVNKWDAKGSGEVDGRFSPVKGHQEMVTWEPSGELAPGIYLPSIKGTSQEAFFVDKTATLRVGANSSLCYDVIKTTAWGIPMGVPDKLESCAKAPAATAAPEAAANGLPKTNENTEQLIQIVGKAAATNDGKLTPANIDIKSIENLLAQGANVNAVRKDDSEPLLISAVSTRRADLVSMLLNKGANPNVRGLVGGDSNDTETPLFRAASVGGLEIVKLLLDKGADLNAKGFRNQTVLFDCFDPEVIEFLVKKGIDINAKNTTGQTALASAEERRSYEKKSIEGTRSFIAKNPNAPGRAQQNLSFSMDRLKRIEDAIEILIRHGAKAENSPAASTASTQAKALAAAPASKTEPKLESKPEAKPAPVPVVKQAPTAKSAAVKRPAKLAATAEPTKVEKKPAAMEKSEPISREPINIASTPNKTLDVIYRERTKAECEKLAISFVCNEKVRLSLCQGKWAPNPPAGQTICTAAQNNTGGTN